ncbi:MAG: serine acetyltransferase, partial [Rikenellaceae bacterium]
MKEIAIYGFGGFGREVACLINMINEVTPQWKIIGFFDDGYAIGTKNRYGEVLGGLNELNNWDRELSVVITIATPHILEKLSSSITNSKVSFPNIMAPNTIIFDNEAFKKGKGNIFFFGCRIS